MRRKLNLINFLAALSLLLSACGGGGGGTSTGATNAATSVASSVGSSAGISSAAASSAVSSAVASSAAASSGAAASSTASATSSVASSSVQSSAAVASSSASSSVSVSSTASASSAASSAAVQACAATSFVGRSKLLIGASMTDASAKAAPFDARYMYLAGGIRGTGQCTNSCDGSCGQWWGCWQDQSLAPGQYVLSFAQTTANATWNGSARPQVPVITYYEFLHSAKTGEGSAEVAALNDAALMTRYLDDWRFLLQKIGSTQALLHIEPDLWGFVRNVNSNPQAIPAKVSSANPSDCATQPETVSGLARCMISMARKYAPAAKVGLHASPWLRANSGDGVSTANFMLALGAADGDFVVADLSDRDAGYYQSIGQNRWFTPTDSANFLAWTKTVATTVGKPMVLWQIPLGNMAQNNTNSHWQDTHVDYLFGHLSEVTDAKVAALLFGAGADLQTTVESDGGNLISKTSTLFQAGGTALCK